MSYASHNREVPKERHKQTEHMEVTKTFIKKEKSLGQPCLFRGCLFRQKIFKSFGGKLVWLFARSF